VVGNYLIGLREGLEAALVVSILIAYLVKIGRRDRLAVVWAGVAIAVGVSVAFGALLSYASTSLLSTFESRETFGGVLSLIAVAFVTWMVFWMRRTARHMRAELSGRLDAALALGTVAVVLTAFFAVAREGLETALFFWSAVQAAGSTAAPVSGFTLGLATAVLLAWLLYRRSVTLNLATFFTWTGAGLIVVAAGVLGYAVHDLQEGGLIPGLNTMAFDVSAQIPPGSWYGTLLKGVFNFSPATTAAQAIAYLAYLVPVMVLFLRRPRVATATAAVRPAAVGRSPAAE
jgi:high-affinity iron transporter